MKFSDLSDAVKLVVTKWLPKEVMIALVGVFPPVINQIKSVYVIQLIPIDYYRLDLMLKQAVEMYKRLSKVTKITSGSPSGSKFKLLHAIGPNLRPDIEYFGGFDCLQTCDAIKYLEKLQKKYPNFDGSRITNEFHADDNDSNHCVRNFVATNPGMKLNLKVNLHSAASLDVGYRIRSLCVESGDQERFQQLVASSPMSFESLEKLDIQCNAPFLINNFYKISSLSPRIKKLSVCLIDFSDWDTVVATDFTDCIHSFPQLESFNLYCTIHDGWNDGRVSAFYSLVTTLMMAHKSSLTHLNIKSNIASSNTVSILLWNNISNWVKFFSLTICLIEIGDDSEVEYSEGIDVANDVMAIKHSEVSLIDVYNKFPRVRHVKVVTADEAYKQRLMEELEVIRNGLPRNRWLTLEFN